MLLFLTRLACFSFSMLERRFGEASDGDGDRSGVFSSKRECDMGSRMDQKSRGDGLLGKGEEFSVYGEVSRETIIFWEVA